MATGLDIFDLTGRVAVITGGATGLGRAMTECLINAGCTVVMMGRRADVLSETA